MIDEHAPTQAAPADASAPLRRRRRKPSGRRWTRGLAIAGVCLVAVGVRVVVGARAELAHGDEARDAGDAEGARLHWRRAAAWYAPLNPYNARAYDRLEAMAREAEASGAIDDAVLAWRALRSALIGARGLTQPHRDRLAEADERIATLMVQQEHAAMDASANDSELRASYLRQLRDVPGPHPAWALVVFVGFALWVGAAFRMSQRAFDAHDRFLRDPGLRHLAAIALGLALFITGLALA